MIIHILYTPQNSISKYNFLTSFEARLIIISLLIFWYKLLHSVDSLKKIGVLTFKFTLCLIELIFVFLLFLTPKSLILSMSHLLRKHLILLSDVIYLHSLYIWSESFNFFFQSVHLRISSLWSSKLKQLLTSLLKLFRLLFKLFLKRFNLNSF